MKRYLLFAGYNFYPSGGFNDFQSSHDTEESAEESAFKTKFNWYQVVDAESGEILQYGIIPGASTWS